MGKFKYNLGKMIACTFIVRMCISVKNIFKPQYRDKMIVRTLIFIFDKLGIVETQKATDNGKGFNQDSESATIDFMGDAFRIAIVLEYMSLAIMAILIVNNIRSFLHKVLVTLKKLLQDNDIEISYPTTLLFFSFIMGTYFLSILLQMSMQLPVEKRKAFEYLLDKLTPEILLYTFDCFFVMSSILGAILIWFNWLVKRTETSS